MTGTVTKVDDELDWIEIYLADGSTLMAQHADIVDVNDAIEARTPRVGQDVEVSRRGLGRDVVHLTGNEREGDGA